jgi:hypothetical protein
MTWQVPDAINGCFEFLASAFILMSARSVFRDKQVRGVWPVHVAFFVAWGYWNIYYYFCIDQLFSWVAGLLVAVVNTVWCFGLFKYWRSK